jgi:hypothetical protein
MRLARYAATLATVVALGSLASAQFTTTGPFVGNAGTESFETQDTSGGAFPLCVVDRVFTSTADLCSGAAHITTGWSFNCVIYPNSGNRFFGSAGGPAIYTFDGTASKFGGYFGTNTGTADGTINFFDEFGALLHTDTINAAADCLWTWNGWDGGGAAIKSIEVIGNPYGAFMMMDDMEVDLGGGSTVGTAFCFAHVGNPGGNVCPCGNENDNSDPDGAGCANAYFAAGAKLSGSGIASITNDTVVLAGTRGQPGNSSMFFQANNNLDGTLVWLDNGVQCAGGGLIRLKVKMNDGTGDALSSPMVITARSAQFNHVIVAGETLYYQWWYRETDDICQQDEDANTSNGYEITWTP